MAVVVPYRFLGNWLIACSAGHDVLLPTNKNRNGKY
jgi:hypothetical protein